MLLDEQYLQQVAGGEIIPIQIVLWVVVPILAFLQMSGASKKRREKRRHRQVIREMRRAR